MLDARRRAELPKQLPFSLDPPVSLADRIPIDTERLLGFSLVIAVYVLLTFWVFIIPFVVLAKTDDKLRMILWVVLAKTFAIIYLGAVIWFILCFILYFDFKDPSTLTRIPGAPADLEDLEREEKVPAKSTT